MVSSVVCLGMGGEGGRRGVVWGWTVRLRARGSLGSGMGWRRRILGLMVRAPLLRLGSALDLVLALLVLALQRVRV